LWAAGFTAGERANALSKMQPAAAVQKFLDQLDEMFGSSQQPRPASAAYVKAHIFDWAQEPYVGGAYSYPSLGARDGDREALAAPVAGTVFFAGECALLCVRTNSKVSPY
jgi:monoamine oxidase